MEETDYIANVQDAFFENQERYMKLLNEILGSSF